MKFSPTPFKTQHHWVQPKALYYFSKDEIICCKCLENAQNTFFNNHYIPDYCYYHISQLTLSLKETDIKESIDIKERI